MPYYIGVDTGGTFTDCVIMDEAGNLILGKAPSTPRDFSEGILNSVAAAASSRGLDTADVLRDTKLFSHAATTATNALLTHNGAKAGLITTKGFEDTILIMRVMGRYAGLGEAAVKRQVKGQKPPPLVPPDRIRGLEERIDYKGEVLTPLDPSAAERAARDLIEAGAESIAVALIWGHRNPVHEEMIRDIVHKLDPKITVSLGSELAPVIGEYERTATTVVNSFLAPRISSYLNNLETRLRDAGFAGSPLVAQAHGGMLNLRQAAHQPVSMIHSGPVCGIMASQYLADLLGYRHVIATDMGGTSFDVGLVYNGVAEPAVETVVGQYHLLVPMVAVDTIGAGAGSIAWVDPDTNRLRVGPDSAAAEPGPACYDQGGELPTVTDADVVLGLLDPAAYLGGRKRLAPEKAEAAIMRHVADPLGMTLQEAAAGIHEIVNAHMSDLIRATTVGRGYDPRRCVLFAYGGAGPLHAYGFGREADAIVVPATASVFSAMGALSADIVRSYQRSSPMRVPVDPQAFNAVALELEARARHDLQEDGFAPEAIQLSRYVTMRHVRQINEIRVPCPPGPMDDAALEQLYRDFEEVYERAFGKGSSFKEAGTQVITFGVEAKGSIAKPVLRPEDRASKDAGSALLGKRHTFLHRQPVLADIYDYARLHFGNTVNGPAIVETPITTIVIDEDQVAEVDEYRNVIVRWN